MRIIKLTFFCAVLFLSINNLNAQEKQDSELFKIIKAKDDLLFNVGFNTCDISQFENLLSENFEFYHDLSGTTLSKASFIKDFKNGLCKPNYKTRRELVEGSLEVYPLKNNGVLYGAIQIGKHRFYEFEKDKTKRFASIAKFTSLWKLEDGNWRLTRCLSYDHQTVDSK